MPGQHLWFRTSLNPSFVQLYAVSIYVSMSFHACGLRPLKAQNENEYVFSGNLQLAAALDWFFQQLHSRTQVVDFLHRRPTQLPRGECHPFAIARASAAFGGLRVKRGGEWRLHQKRLKREKVKFFKRELFNVYNCLEEYDNRIKPQTTYKTWGFASVSE